MAAAVPASRPYCPAAGTTTASSLGTCSTISMPTVPSPARYASLSSLENRKKQTNQEIDQQAALICVVIAAQSWTVKVQKGHQQD